MERYRNITVHTTFLLDRSLHICAIAPDLADMLSGSISMLIGKSLISIVNEHSARKLFTWQGHEGTFSNIDPQLHLGIQLNFKRQYSDEMVSLLCHISTLPDLPGVPGKWMTVACESEKQESEGCPGSTSAREGMVLIKNGRRIVFHHYDIKKIHRVANYLIKYLEIPSPLIKTLANTFGINEFKLKCGFKVLFGTTISCFHIEQCLEKGKFLIRNTDWSMQNISKMTGFKSHSHFCRAFKEKYGMPPSTFKYQHYLQQYESTL